MLAKNTHHHLQIPGVKSSQLSCVLLPKSLYFLLATSAVVITKVEVFSQFEDRVKNIMFSFKFYFKNIYIFQTTTLFSVYTRIQYQNIMKTHVKQIHQRSVLSFTKQTNSRTKFIQVLGTQNPCQVQNRIYNLKIKLGLIACAFK